MRKKGQESSKQQHLSTETRLGSEASNVNTQGRGAGEEQGRQKKNEKYLGKQQPLSHGQKSGKRGKQRQYARGERS